jgi:hypothetical protein
MAPRFKTELHPLLSQINIDIDWRAIVGCSISRVRLSPNGPTKLGDILAAWFTCDGAPVCHRHDPHYPNSHLRRPREGDLAVTLAEAASRGFNHPWMSEQKIGQHKPNGPVQLTFPAYDVERGRYLLLDGAHRSVATLRAGVDYNIKLAVIHGPIDRRVFADLAIFE